VDDDLDRYEAWYSAKLWNLLPAIYRAEDSTELDRKGPLQELVERIGAQAAIVRRSIDRLWQDQSIETCDDWVIDYLGDLLATNLVASLDARGRRVDVAKTIRYRRRKGTVGLLEELATDITGWSVRVVEMFHRLGRTRHGLDPAIGDPAEPSSPRGRLQREQRLVGVHTRTSAGGFADLRAVHGANLAGTAFDEYFHTADVRRGRGRTGWYGISHVGVFVWRLRSFPLRQVTAVRDLACPNQYTFDPTGRDTPLFAAGDPPRGDRWASPREDQVPGAISRDLLRFAFDDLYPPEAPRSLAVHRWIAGIYQLVPAAEIALDARDAADPSKPARRFFIDPERGRIIAPTGSSDGPYRVDYHAGFSSEIGAGAFERRAPGRSIADAPLPHERVTGGEAALAAALPRVAPTSTGAGTGTGTGTIELTDSLTYTSLEDATAIVDVELRAVSMTRPVIRPTVIADWVFRGKDRTAALRLDGLFVAGPDVVLAGDFDRVTISCCTLDPGRWDAAAADWAIATDGRPLSASRLRIEGSVRRLVIERSIVGPILDLGAGRVEHLEIRDTIVQAVQPAIEALALATGELALSRSTILGTFAVHRLDASECILDGTGGVADTQHGCVRFTAWREGSSALPRQYESVRVATGAGLFVSDDFGRPEYGQLLATAGDAIRAGAEDGSEMGAFAREKSAIKERSLLIKYQEYLPLGLEPVIVHVT
jgi:hypothetical protein